MLSGALFPLLLIGAQAIGNAELFGSDAQSIKRVRNQSTLTCSHDVASIAYESRSAGGDRIVRASVNRKIVRKPDVDAINAYIGSSKIAKIDWKRCPAGNDRGSSIMLYLQMEVASGKRFFVLNLSRDGKLTRE